MYWSGLFLSLLFIFFNHKPLKDFHLSGYTQGTTYHITYYARENLVSQSEVEQILSRIDSSLSVYKSYSVISKFNKAQRGIKPDLYLKEVLDKSLEIYNESNGIFDITVYPLVNAWGFGPGKVSTLPDSADIKAIMPCIGSDKIFIKGDSLLKADPCVKIDVNGIAQGYSVDLLAEYLEQKKIATYLVEIGGELRVKGRKPDGQLMRIGIESPPESVFNTQQYRSFIQIKEGAVTTSGNYRKFKQAGNRKISHLIDPKTGYYLQNRMISATVIARNAITADGYDNVLMGMEPAAAIDFVNKHKDLQAYLIYQKADGSIADTVSKGFYRLITEPE